jgi:hypothetical protein
VEMIDRIEAVTPGFNLSQLTKRTRTAHASYLLEV